MPSTEELQLIRGFRPKRKAGRLKRASLTVGIKPADRDLLDAEAEARGTTAKTLARQGASPCAARWPGRRRAR
jgi:hypothetical protein